MAVNYCGICFKTLAPGGSTGPRYIFYNFYLVKNQKIANNSATTEAREKNKHIIGILRILENF
jgi:hypothetical protein